MRFDELVVSECIGVVDDRLEVRRAHKPGGRLSRSAVGAQDAPDDVLGSGLLEADHHRGALGSERDASCLPVVASRRAVHQLLVRGKLSHCLCRRPCDDLSEQLSHFGELLVGLLERDLAVRPDVELQNAVEVLRRDASVVERDDCVCAAELLREVITQGFGLELVARHRG